MAKRDPRKSWNPEKYINEIQFDYTKMFTTPYDFGAIADGKPHPLSEKYSILALAQVIYPHATSLTNEIDWCAIQGAINCFGTSEGVVDLGHGKYIINKDITRPRKVTLKGHGMGRAIIKSNSTTVYTIKTVGKGTAGISEWGDLIEGFTGNAVKLLYGDDPFNDSGNAAKIKDVEIRNTDKAIEFRNNCWLNQIEGCRLFDNTVAGIYCNWVLDLNKASILAVTNCSSTDTTTTTTGFKNLPLVRRLCATVGGTTANIKAVGVTVTGTNSSDVTIVETLPAFTEDTAGMVLSVAEFKTVTKLEIPAMDGDGVTVSLGFGAINSGAAIKITRTDIFNTKEPLRIDGACKDGADIHITSCDWEHADYSITTNDSPGVVILCTNLHGELNNYGYMNINDGNVQVDNCWFFENPDTDYIAHFICSKGRINLNSGRISFSDTKLAKVTGTGEIYINPQQIISGNIVTGYPHSDTSEKGLSYPKGYKLGFISSPQDLVAVSYVVDTFPKFDTSIREYNFLVEMTAPNHATESPKLRVYANPGGAVARDIALPKETGLVKCKIIWQPNTTAGVDVITIEVVFSGSATNKIYYATLDNTQALNLRRTLDLQMFYMGTGTAVIRNLTKTILS